MMELLWDSENKYWYCSCCGAVYRKPQNWNPPADYCMRCRVRWENINFAKENPNEAAK